MARDPLASWWGHTITVQRLSPIGGAGGDVYDAPVSVTGFYRDGTKLVTNGDGKQELSSAQFAFPITVARIPVGSLVTGPPQFGSRQAKVIVSNIGDGAGQPTPDHHEIALL